MRTNADAFDALRGLARGYAPLTPQKQFAEDDVDRNCRLYLRCHADELAKWKECACQLDLSLSSYARFCLNKGPSLSRIVRVDPVLVRQLAAIGNNLNQIARRVNVSLTLKDRFMLEQVLEAIRHDLEQMFLNLEGKKC